MDAQLKPVSKDEFFKRIGGLDVHPSFVNDRYPYTSEWRIRQSRTLVGQSVGHTDGSHDYFLVA